MVPLLISIPSTCVKRQEIMNKNKNDAPVACSYARPSDKRSGDQETAGVPPDPIGPSPCIMVNEISERQNLENTHAIEQQQTQSETISIAPSWPLPRHVVCLQSWGLSILPGQGYLIYAPRSPVVLVPFSQMNLMQHMHPEVLPDLAAGRYRSQYLLEGPQPLLRPGQDPIKVEFSMKLQSLPDDIRFQIVDNMLFCQKKHGHGPLEF